MIGEGAMCDEGAMRRSAQPLELSAAVRLKHAEISVLGSGLSMQPLCFELTEGRLQTAAKLNTRWALLERKSLKPTSTVGRRVAPTKACTSIRLG